MLLLGIVLILKSLASAPDIVINGEVPVNESVLDAPRFSIVNIFVLTPTLLLACPKSV